MTIPYVYSDCTIYSNEFIILPCKLIRKNGRSLDSGTGS